MIFYTNVGSCRRERDMDSGVLPAGEIFELISGLLLVKDFIDGMVSY